MTKANRRRTFLKANWLRLASANYIIDSSILQNHLPKGTILEPYIDQHYVSLVAFRYCETRLLNVRVPYHHIFEEVNLRFYVQREIAPGQWRSEVAFTKLYFPKRALTFIARTIFKENYETTKMSHKWQENGNELITSYGLQKDHWHNFEIRSNKHSAPINPDSPEHFFSKHYWGCCRVNTHSATVYEIEHPAWETHEVLSSEITFDFSKVFGSEFACLNEMEPESVHLYNGSEVIVNKKKII